MRELQDLYQIHRTNEKVLLRLLERWTVMRVKIDERIHHLITLKEEILDYQKKFDKN